MQRRSGAVRAAAVRTGPNRRAQSRPTTGNYSVGAPTSDKHFSSSARQISPKFSGFLGEGAPCRRAKKFRNLTREFRENRGQSTPGRKFQPPISPPNGRRSPANKICFYQGPQAYNAQWPLRGKPIGGSPGGGSPNGAELERAKSADNAKVLGRVHQIRTNVSRVPLVRFRPNFQGP